MLLSILLFFLIFFYYFLHSNYNYWKKRKINGPTPRYIFGNIGESLRMKKSQGEIYTEIYRNFPDSPLVGIYLMFKPTLIVKDPDLIKSIFIKNFNNFHDNDFYVDKKTDPIFARNLFVLRGEEWKNSRVVLTPCFTSGKMKSIYPLINKISRNLVKFIENQNSNALDSREVCIRFTLNNVASCAFGLDGKCFDEPNSEFKKLAKEFLSPDSVSFLSLFIITNLPKLAKMFSFKLTSKKAEDKLQNIISQTIKYRKQNNIVRNDFLDILINLKENSKTIEFTDIDITAQAASFFGDGYETSSVVMSFFLYELASNSDVQNKLRDEINQKWDGNNNEINYTDLIEMPYFEACYMENLRKHPPAYNLIKLCTENFKYDKYTIEKGTSIILPLYAIQHDPQYYTDPETFLPERFLGENKEKIIKGSYFPLGDGPRSCIGQRFGSLQIKTGIAHILRNFELSVNDRTQLPLKFNPTYLLIVPIGGLWLNFKKITK